MICEALRLYDDVTRNPWLIKHCPDEMTIRECLETYTQKCQKHEQQPRLSSKRNLSAKAYDQELNGAKWKFHNGYKFNKQNT